MRKKKDKKVEPLMTIDSDNLSLWKEQVKHHEAQIKAMEDQILVHTAYLETAKRRVKYYQDEEVEIYE